MRSVLRARSSRALLFTLECALGIVAVILVAAFAHWSQWLLPVAVLLYLLIVVPTALLSGFWQAVIVSLTAVVVHSYFTTRQTQSNPAADPANTVTLLAFVLVALVVSRLSARVTDNARAAESWGGQMHDLYEFTRRTLQMNLHEEPGPQLAELVHEISRWRRWRYSTRICIRSIRPESGALTRWNWRRTSTTLKPRTTTPRPGWGDGW